MRFLSALCFMVERVGVPAKAKEEDPPEPPEGLVVDETEEKESDRVKVMGEWWFRVVSKKVMMSIVAAEVPDVQLWSVLLRSKLKLLYMRP